MTNFIQSDGRVLHPDERERARNMEMRYACNLLNSYIRKNLSGTDVIFKKKQLYLCEYPSFYVVEKISLIRKDLLGRIDYDKSDSLFGMSKIIVRTVDDRMRHAAEETDEELRNIKRQWKYLNVVIEVRTDNLLEERIYNAVFNIAVLIMFLANITALIMLLANITVLLASAIRLVL